MQISGTMEVLRRLKEEGFDISKARLESIISTGKTRAPAVVGTSRAWTDTDVAELRKALVGLDAAPARTVTRIQTSMAGEAKHRHRSQDGLG